MQNTQQTINPAPAPVERVFDENGVTIGEVPPAAAPEESAPEATEPPAAEAPPATAAATPKFRIGDREFASQEEALAYAEQAGREANAQQQYLQQLQQPPVAPQPSVTPAAPPAVPEEFYTNPTAYLEKYGRDIQDKTLAQVSRQLANQAQSDQIWREFVDRHPDLADFRSEVEAFTAQNLGAVRGLASTKGLPSSYDFIATKIRSDWNRKFEALKPKRDLPNTVQARTPSQRTPGVTPEVPAKKPATFAEQINSIRKRGRRA